MVAWDPARALAEERARTQERLAGLTGDYDGIVAASVDSNADDEHDPEGATIAFERSQVGSLIRQARRHLAEVAAAEQRLHAGTYGRCEACGATIAEGRLEARPVARRCIDCAAKDR
jgi:RNA polymerase-binding transcription factor DksA